MRAYLERLQMQLRHAIERAAAHSRVGKVWTISGPVTGSSPLDRTLCITRSPTWAWSMSCAFCTSEWTRNATCNNGFRRYPHRAGNHPSPRELPLKQKLICVNSSYNITIMVGPTDKETLIEVMSPLVAGLYTSLDRALTLARQHFIDFDMTGPEYLPAVHHLARAHSRRLLLTAGADGELGNWDVAKPKPNLQVLLRNEALEFRLLRPVGTDVPPPGPNWARQAYYTNIHDNLLGIRGSRLLGLWLVDPDSGEVVIRVVRPIGTWRWGANAKLDIDFFLPRAVDTLENLEFVPTQSLERVFLPFEADEEQGGDGVASHE